MMNLKRANNLSLWKEDETSKGMINKVKDYVAYGKINDATLKALIENKARPIDSLAKLDTKKVFEELKKGKSLKEAGIKNIFTMSPPQGGFERKGIKVPFKLGGALGNRSDKINELIMKMM